jgi:hypothetical protein
VGVEVESEVVNVVALESARSCQVTWRLADLVQQVAAVTHSQTLISIRGSTQYSAKCELMNNFAGASVLIPYESPNGGPIRHSGKQQDKAAVNKAHHWHLTKPY